MAHHALVLLFLLSAWISAVVNATNDTTACPSQVDALLDSSLYHNCQRDIAETMGVQSAWVFTATQTDAVHSSADCLTTLLVLGKMPVDKCWASVRAADGSVVRVTVDQAELDEIAEPCRRRRFLRFEAVTRFLSDDDSSTSTFSYLLVVIAALVLVGLICCAFGTCGTNRYPES